ncbi:MAG: hypothetical protein KBS79_02735 [Lachnospiraceae bacterium]|nr:hypothetical protein [Candidatus Minthocola equi]
MYCKYCGAELKEGEEKCSFCGMPVEGAPAANQESAPEPSTEEIKETPVAAAEPEVTAESEKERPMRSKGLAIAALICMIASYVMCCVPFLQVPLAVVAIILAILGIRSEYKTMAIISLIFAIISLIFGVIIIVTSILMVTNTDFINRFLLEFEKQYPGTFDINIDF